MYQISHIESESLLEGLFEPFWQVSWDLLKGPLESEETLQRKSSGRYYSNLSDRSYGTFLKVHSSLMIPFWQVPSEFVKSLLESTNRTLLTGLVWPSWRSTQAWWNLSDRSHPNLWEVFWNALFEPFWQVSWDLLEGQFESDGTFLTGPIRIFWKSSKSFNPGGMTMPVAQDQDMTFCVKQNVTINSAHISYV